MSTPPGGSAVPEATCPWDGEPGWPRPRHVTPHREGGPRLPATYVQSDPTDATSAEPQRMQEVFLKFRCQVCAEPVLDVDTVGWVLSPIANMGGACCTRCMYLAVHACPHLAGAPLDEWAFWEVTEPRGYTWHVVDGTTDGHIQVDPSRATPRPWVDFIDHYVAWRRAQVSSAASG